MDGADGDEAGEDDGDDDGAHGAVAKGPSMRSMAHLKHGKFAGLSRKQRRNRQAGEADAETMSKLKHAARAAKASAKPQRVRVVASPSATASPGKAKKPHSKAGTGRSGGGGHFASEVHVPAGTSGGGRFGSSGPGNKARKQFKSKSKYVTARDAATLTRIPNAHACVLCRRDAGRRGRHLDTAAAEKMGSCHTASLHTLATVPDAANGRNALQLYNKHFFWTYIEETKPCGTRESKS